MIMEKLKIRALTTRQVAEIFPALNPGTLQNLRSQKLGPNYFKVGRKVFYRLEDVELWLYRNPVLTKEQ